jgi:hypothetical protein
MYPINFTAVFTSLWVSNSPIYTLIIDDFKRVFDVNTTRHFNYFEAWKILYMKRVLEEREMKQNNSRIAVTFFTYKKARR